jgi:hypothetical protein
MMRGESVKRLSLGVLVLFLFAMELNAQTYYVATTGSDSSDGSFDHPFRTIPKGISVATVPGTTIYVRGGTYAYSTTITISRSGNSTDRYKLFAYPGERPFLDFSSMPISSGNRGIRLSGSYWYIKGFDIWKAGDNGMNVSGSNNIIEFCSFSENGDTGLQLGGGASNNQVINCDSYYNVDASQGNADGFAPKLDVGTGNYFYGCRAWQNSDDGWDGYLRPADNVTTTIENCWNFKNGYLKNGNASTGNGNGYKMGGGDNSNADSLRHNMILKNCLAFDNRVKGFDQNNNRGSMTLLNCTAYRNGTNYQITGPIRSTSVVTVKNCVALGAYGSLGGYAVQATNSWMPPFVVTSDDFVSIDTAGVRDPRNADGSLPDIVFMHLVPGSDLIDAGTNVGLPFFGSGPDLGAFEYDTSGSLPIQLATFTAAYIGGTSVRLDWMTLSEVSNFGFYVQRRRASESIWTELSNSLVPGHGTTNVPQRYAFIDSTASAEVWVYRLRQVDLDSTSHFTYIIQISTLTGVAEDIPRQFVLMQNYPNPFNPTTEIRFSVERNGWTTLAVYNILGQKVATLFDEFAEAERYYSVKLDGSNLASGVYFYQLQSEGQGLVKRMLMLK